MTRNAIRAGWLVGSVTATTVSYLLFLGWNATKGLTLEEPGSIGVECTGPYEAWQVISLGVALAVLVVAGAWARHGFLVPAAGVVTLTTLFTVDAITVDDPCSDGIGLLPIGVALLLAGSTVAAIALVAVTVAIRNAGSGPC